MDKNANLFYANFMHKVGFILKNNSVLEDEFQLF